MRFAAQNKLFLESQLVHLKNNDWLEKQRIAGKVVGKCLQLTTQLSKDASKISLKDIEKFCEEIIKSEKCEPTFKGYKGFPGAICTSVNKQLVHGIPTDYVLKQGDLLSVDVGVTFEGVIADAAMTCIFGEPIKKEHVKLLESCKEALYESIKTIAVDKQLGCIGEVIHRKAKNSGFYVISNYGGHGINLNNPHAEPFVSNKTKYNEGLRIQTGLVIAIEPMFAIGSAKTKTLDDGWTVVTRDLSCHMEHTIFVHEDHIEIITEF